MPAEHSIDAAIECLGQIVSDEKALNCAKVCHKLNQINKCQEIVDQIQRKVSVYSKIDEIAASDHDLFLATGTLTQFFRTGEKENLSQLLKSRYQSLREGLAALHEKFFLSLLERFTRQLRQDWTVEAADSLSEFSLFLVENEIQRGGCTLRLLKGVSTPLAVTRAYLESIEKVDFVADEFSLHRFNERCLLEEERCTFLFGDCSLQSLAEAVHLECVFSFSTAVVQQTARWCERQRASFNFDVLFIEPVACILDAIDRCLSYRPTFQMNAAYSSGSLEECSLALFQAVAFAFTEVDKRILGRQDCSMFNGAIFGVDHSVFMFVRLCTLVRNHPVFKSSFFEREMRKASLDVSATAVRWLESYLKGAESFKIPERLRLMRREVFVRVHLLVNRMFFLEAFPSKSVHERMLEGSQFLSSLLSPKADSIKSEAVVDVCLLVRFAVFPNASLREEYRRCLLRSFLPAYEQWYRKLSSKEISKYGTGFIFTPAELRSETTTCF